MRRRAGVLAASALCAACSGPVWKDLDARLAAASAPARAAGFQPMAGPFNNFGSFRDSLVKAWHVDLDAGVPYVAGAACSAHCTALDAVVTGPNGATLAADTATAPAPFVGFTTPEAGRYTITLRGRCTGRCWWASQIYAKGVAGTLRPGFAGGEH